MKDTSTGAFPNFSPVGVWGGGIPGCMAGPGTAGCLAASLPQPGLPRGSEAKNPPAN